MNLEDKSAALEPGDASSTKAGPEEKILELPTAAPEEPKAVPPEGIEVRESGKVGKQPPQRNEMPRASGNHASELVESTSFEVTQSKLPQKPESFFRERPPQVMEVAPRCCDIGVAATFCSSEWAR